MFNLIDLKLTQLYKFLIKKNYLQESEEIKSIIKLSTLSGLKTLGLQDSAAKLFNEIVGNKWDYVIAKWFLEYYLYGNKFSEYSGRWGLPEKEDPVQNLKALNAIDKLLSKNVNDRKKFCQIDIDCKNLKNWIEAHDLRLELAWEEEILEEWSIRYNRGNPIILPDESLSSWMEELKDNLTKKISEFIKTDFMKDLMENKILSPGQAKDRSFYDVEKNWLETKTLSLPIILEFDDKWKWVNAGGGNSTWVAKNLKNCGSVTWGNLRATPESRKYAEMIVLMDPQNKPHGLVTWNPKYVDYDNLSKPPIRFLSHIEGVGSSPLKAEYYSYFSQLVNYLQPDQIYIPNKSQHNMDGEVIDNKNLKSLFDPSFLTEY